MDLTRKSALVTGASKGIGKGIARRLGALGCDVAVNYHSDSKGAEEVVKAVRQDGRTAFSVQGSVAESAQVQRMFDTVLTRFERLDILVNNAGTQVWSPLLDLREEDWDRVIDTNLKGCFLCTQLAARHMKDKGGGRIVNIGSGCNKVAFPNLVSYTASKGGMEQFTKVAAAELGRYGITVNCVAPGAILIGRTSREADDYAGQWSRLTPMGRVGYPRDVAEAVAFLCTDAAEFVSGQTLMVDGGIFTRGPWAY
ncbi:MAG: 3-oxoacyl-ACP reductase FabG [Bryobacterales bacterium]|nr:3-oxoacyl-ACP reductase FabG [Bryobacterales bacterium]MDE0629319.1 3-oxoacyl-ACP reductase FabG [Bryobacterales bacterium]